MVILSVLGGRVLVMYFLLIENSYIPYNRVHYAECFTLDKYVVFLYVLVIVHIFHSAPTTIFEFLSAFVVSK